MRRNGDNRIRAAPISSKRSSGDIKQRPDGPRPFNIFVNSGNSKDHQETLARSSKKRLRMFSKNAKRKSRRNYSTISGRKYSAPSRADCPSGTSENSRRRPSRSHSSMGERAVEDRLNPVRFRLTPFKKE